MTKPLSPAQRLLLARLEQHDMGVLGVHAATAKALLSRGLIHVVSFGFELLYRRGPNPGAKVPDFLTGQRPFGISRTPSPFWRNHAEEDAGDL